MNHISRLPGHYLHQNKALAHINRLRDEIFALSKLKQPHVPQVMYFRSFQVRFPIAEALSDSM